MADDLVARNRANKIRNILGLGQSPIPEIFNLMEDIGIYAFKKPFLNSNLSAIFMKNRKNHLVIINSNRTLGHQNFSAAHELSHYYFDKEMLGGLCSINSKGHKIEAESMADMFASHFLMPDDGVIDVAEKRKNKDGKIVLYDIVFLQQYFNVSWIAMLRKLKYLGYIKSIDDFYNIRITPLTEKLHYDKKLITKTMEKYVSKKYLEMIMKCYDNDEISKTKAFEFLEDVDLNIEDITSIEDITQPVDTFDGRVNYED